MRALLLGGSGFFGTAALEKVAPQGGISHVVIASRSAESAEEAARSARCATSTIALDIYDEAALSRAIEAVDLVLNAAGDAPRTAPLAIRAAINANKPYVDISAEVSVLLDAEKSAQATGAPQVPVVLGAGIHPGMVEFFGASAAAALDQVERIDMYMLATLEKYGPTDRFIPMFEAGWDGISGLQTMCTVPGMEAIQIRDGKRVLVAPGAEITAFDTLEGESLNGFPMATIEPLALHRCLPTVGTVTMNISYWPPAANEIVQSAAPGLVRGDQEFAVTMLSMWKTIADENRALPEVHFWAEAIGTKNGRPASAKAFSRQDWANQGGGRDTTASMLIYTAGAIARGDVRTSGFLAPVNLFDPDDVYSHLAGSNNHGAEIALDGFRTVPE